MRVSHKGSSEEFLRAERTMGDYQSDSWAEGNFTSFTTYSMPRVHT